MLSEERITSSIPRGETRAEGHWVYPSPAMLHAALAARGKRVDAHALPLLVDIHNAVNEQTWVRIVRLEKTLFPGAHPRLVSFVGRPGALSPRALANWALRGCVLPFDRHDWAVQRPDGSVARYVIDYYAGRGDAAVHIDARPAIDRPADVLHRVRLFLHSLWR